MAKAKASKARHVDPNRTKHSRVSYLFQAATYLAMNRHSNDNGLSQHEEAEDSYTKVEHPRRSLGATRRLLSDLRNVSLKAQLRLSPAMKHTVCKNCDTLLIDGSTCLNSVENKSKGGKKPWADVWLRQCAFCGAERRYPVAAERQPRRPKRAHEEAATMHSK